MCKSLKTVVLNEGLEVLGTNEYQDNGSGYYGVFQRSVIDSVTLPSTLKRVEYYAFKTCRNLKSINLPKKLEHIGDGCFSGSGIGEILIPKTVKFIGEDALPPLSQANVEKGSQDDGNKVIGGVPIISGVARIPDGTKTIAKGLFKGQNVRKVIIPKSVEEI